MIKVTMELCVGGLDSPETNEHLGTILITNQLSESLSSSGKRGGYKALIYKKRSRKVWKKVTIADYPRKAYHPWELVRRILEKARPI